MKLTAIGALIVGILTVIAGLYILILQPERTETGWALILSGSTTAGGAEMLRRKTATK